MKSARVYEMGPLPDRRGGLNTNGPLIYKYMEIEFVYIYIYIHLMFHRIHIKSKNKSASRCIPHTAG